MFKRLLICFWIMNLYSYYSTAVMQDLLKSYGLKKEDKPAAILPYLTQTLRCKITINDFKLSDDMIEDCCNYLRNSKKTLTNQEVLSYLQSKYPGMLTPIKPQSPSISSKFSRWILGR